MGCLDGPCWLSESGWGLLVTLALFTVSSTLFLWGIKELACWYGEWFHDRRHRKNRS